MKVVEDLARIPKIYLLLLENNEVFILFFVWRENKLLLYTFFINLSKLAFETNKNEMAHNYNRICKLAYKIK